MDEKILELLDKDDFSAIKYIDSLTENVNLNDNETLAKHEKSMNNIVNNLGVYSNSCQIEIDGKILHVNKVFDKVSENNTKLQYYINSLLNIINKLIENSDSKIMRFSNNDAVVTSLINLKKIENSLVRVDKLFQTAKFICTINQEDEDANKEMSDGKLGEKDGSVVSLDTFKECLVSLKDILVEQLKVNKSLIKSSQSSKILNSIIESNSLIYNKIDSLSELKHIFAGISNFDAEYMKFIDILVSERHFVEQAFAERQKYFKTKEEEQEQEKNKQQYNNDQGKADAITTKSQTKDSSIGDSDSKTFSANNNPSEAKKKSTDAAAKSKTTESSGFGGWFNFSI